MVDCTHRGSSLDCFRVGGVMAIQQTQGTNMKKRYRLDSGMDTSITLDIDTDKIPETVASEINSFWMGADDVLDHSDGDVFQAIARRAAGPLLGYLMDGYHERGAVEMLSKEEGWPDAANGGITVIDHEIPTLAALDYEVTTLAA